MKKQKLDKNIFLGGVIIDNKDYQVVHLNLKKGNQTDDYSNEHNIVILNINGKISVKTEDEIENLEEFEILEIEKNKKHIITCVEDSQVVIFKI